ncbi:MAG: helix-turn-helix domain-containing protein, partial [Pseudomonadota bacterium]
LYYRLNILRIDVPPLRERLGDIGVIAQALQRQVGQRLTMTPDDARATQTLIDALVLHAPHYDWPGNVRELENIIERVMAYGVGAPPGAALEAQAFLRATAPELFAHTLKTPAQQPGEGLKGRQAQVERAEILKVLAECEGDRGLASERLGISRTTLWRKLKG